MKKTIQFETEKHRKMITDYLAEPIKIGDDVLVQGKYLGSNVSQDADEWNSIDVIDILPDGRLKLQREGYTERDYHGEINIIDPKKVEVRKDTLRVGVNPFPEKNWFRCCRHTGLGLGQIIYKCEDMLENGNVAHTVNGVDIMEYNFNPYVTDKDGKKIYFQRDYCWTLEDEQMFIESIYNYLNLGTVVLRKRSYDWVNTQALAGNKEVAYYDIIDGKQRIHTLMRFMKNEFPDIHGNYYGDFSERARRIMNFNSQGLNVMEIEENATDEDVLRVFLNVNYSGKPMSREHLDYVRSLFDNVKQNH